MTRSKQKMISSGHHTLSARHFRGVREDTSGSRPCIVMAHGIGATADSGLYEFAEAFAAAGYDAIVFDYRHFAGSSGHPRQLVSPEKQIDDYLAAVAFARSLDGVDPEQIVVWGVSFSGGHVFRVAERDQRLLAAIALTPATDGAAVVVDMVRRQPLSYFTSLVSSALRDWVSGRLGRAPVLVPIVAEPGRPAALNAPGAVRGMTATAGVSWQNSFAARLFLSVGAYRPITSARHLRCHILVQIADLDQSAPPRPAALAAQRARATVHHYPCDHFDVYPSAAWHSRVLTDQLRFLARITQPKKTKEAS